jgi:hypothetical protein
MAWEVEYTREFEEWWETLTEQQQHDLDQRVRLLEQKGPQLKRPVVGIVKASRYKNMKEIIYYSDNAHLRVLFIFDPRTHAVLLLGGDKTGEWEKWYQRAIPEAERIYGEYLNELEKEGLIA